MEALFNQIFTLLTTSVGSLIYHLVLAFSIAGALQVALNNSSHADRSQPRRMIFGLGLLLALQLSLFIGSGLAWQGVFPGDTWLPPLDRAVMLVSLVIIIWLWAFPNSNSAADGATLLVGLLVITGVTLGAVWWSGQVPGGSYNYIIADIAAQIAAIGLILVGVTLLFTRRPYGWEYGVVMLGVLFAGHLAYLLLPVQAGNYAAIVRLAQMAAYPMILLLPQRLVTVASGQEWGDGQITLKTQAGGGALVPQGDLQLLQGEPLPLQDDPLLLRALHKVVAEDDPGRVCQLITATMARIMEADLCLFIMPPDKNGQLIIRCGYDQERDRYLESTSIDSRGAPRLASAFRHGRSRRLSGETTSPDLASLSRAQNLSKAGRMLFVPVLNTGGSPMAGFVMLSPFSERDWTNEDQSYASLLSKLLVQFLQRSQQMADLTEELDWVREMSNIIKDQTRRAQDEGKKLRDQLTVLKDSAEQDRLKLASMAAMAANQVAKESAIAQLQAENERLKQAARDTSVTALSQSESTEEELRLALSEIAHLHTSLDEADDRIKALSVSFTDAPPSDEQLETLVHIAQDMRQPLSSIVGYADFLLSEQIGILGEKQRKYMERIRVSTERMNRSIDDLMQVTAAESNASQLHIEEVDVGDLLRESLTSVNQQLVDKRIKANVDLPESPLHVDADQGVLSRIFEYLIHNAVGVTLNGSDIHLSARLESSETDLDYVLVQVKDSGEGIPASDLPSVFSPREPGKATHVVADGGLDMPNVKALVEVQGGRIWVDSEPNQGTVFSVLLQVQEMDDLDILGDAI